VPRPTPPSPLPPRRRTAPSSPVRRSRRQSTRAGSRPPSSSLSPRRFPSGRVSAGTVDRKSTRLNSSHVSMSYAVFCLKKKIGALPEGIDLNDSHLLVPALGPIAAPPLLLSLYLASDPSYAFLLFVLRFAVPSFATSIT